MLYVDIEKRLDRFTLKAKLEYSGEPSALFGASGAGKSLTLKCIAGIVKPDKGVIRLNDRVLFDSEKKINLPPQKRNVGYLFQDYALFPNMNVRENIMTGLKRCKKPQRDEKARELIDSFRLGGLEKARISTLSGGEKQRVALARIFASSPEVLLLDEPFSSLDTSLKLELIPYIGEVIDSFGGEVVLVSHSIDEVVRLCKRVTPISSGVTEKTVVTKDFYSRFKVKYEKAGVILPEYKI